MAEHGVRRALSYVLGGVAVGAGLGVLFADRPGRETRRDLAQWLRDKRERAGGLIEKFRERIPAKRERVLAALRAGKEAFRDGERKEDLAHA